jgi:hypothetical protein
MRSFDRFFRLNPTHSRVEARHMLKALADRSDMLDLGPEFDTFKAKIEDARSAYEAGMSATGEADLWRA